MNKLLTIQKARYTPHLFSAVAIGFVLLYILSTFSIVRNTAIRARFERESNKLSNLVGDLEYTYISMKSGLSAENLASAGLEASNQISYVSRTTGVTALALELNRTR